MYHEWTVEHQEYNTATNWLMVFDDQNEEDSPFQGALFICRGKAFVVPEGLVQLQLNGELEGNCIAAS